MAIDLGQQNIVVQRSLSLRSIRIEGLETASEKKMHIDYIVDGELRTYTIEGEAWNTFYSVTWLDGRPIFNDTGLAQIIGQPVDLETAENQFINEIIPNGEAL